MIFHVSPRGWGIRRDGLCRDVCVPRDGIADMSKNGTSAPASLASRISGMKKAHGQNCADRGYQLSRTVNSRQSTVDRSNSYGRRIQ